MRTAPGGAGEPARRGSFGTGDWALTRAKPVRAARVVAVYMLDAMLYLLNFEALRC